MYWSKYAILQYAYKYTYTPIQIPLYRIIHLTVFDPKTPTKHQNFSPMTEIPAAQKHDFSTKNEFPAPKSMVYFESDTHLNSCMIQLTVNDQNLHVILEIPEVKTKIPEVKNMPNSNQKHVTNSDLYTCVSTNSCTLITTSIQPINHVNFIKINSHNHHLWPTTSCIQACSTKALNPIVSYRFHVVQFTVN